MVPLILPSLFQAFQLQLGLPPFPVLEQKTVELHQQLVLHGNLKQLLN
jgi:hypothetical protein